MLGPALLPTSLGRHCWLREQHLLQKCGRDFTPHWTFLLLYLGHREGNRGSEDRESALETETVLQR